MTDVREVAGRCWVPGNRWDLVADRIDGARASSVAVIVPYFEQPDSLRRMYGALADLDPAVHTLVVADDGSSRAPAPAPPDDFPLRTIRCRQEDLGCRPGAARNLAAASVDAEVLVFLDADTVPAPGTVERLAAWPTVLPDALVVGRRGHVDLTGWSPAQTAAWLAGTGPAPPRRPDPQWLDDGYRWTKDLLDVDERSYRYVISAVMACHRVLFDEIGGFDAERDEYGGEDWELAFRAHNNGAVLVHDPLAVAWHDEPDWSERAGGSSKAAETLWLASVVPEPLTRGTPVLQPWSRVVVDLMCDDEPTGAVVTTIGDVLTAAPDCLVVLRGEVGPPTLRHLAHDPRITTVAPSRRQRQRAHCSLVVHRPLRWSPEDLRAVLELAATTPSGTVEVHDPAGAVLATVQHTATTARRRRAERAGSAPDTPPERRAADEVGATLIGGELDLAAAFRQR